MSQSISPYQLISALMQYPEQPLLDALPEIEQVLQTISCGQQQCVVMLSPLLEHLRQGDLLSRQSFYVATFDSGHRYSLHLFEHIYGESKERGPAMNDLLMEYRTLGLSMEGNELPDYLPLFLEALSQISAEQAVGLLNEAVHVIAHIGCKLEQTDNPYACLFKMLCAYSTVPVQALTEPPVRDMDEMLAKYGPGVDGSEPLLNHSPDQQQSITFYRRHKDHFALTNTLSSFACQAHSILQES